MEIINKYFAISGSSCAHKETNVDYI